MTDEPAVSLETFYDAVESEGRPVLSASDVARRVGCSPEEARAALAELVDAGKVERVGVDSESTVWYPHEWGDVESRERVVVFPDRREVVVDRPEQFTRAQLTQFAHLVDSTGTDPGTRGYLYRIREEDVWNAPFDDLASLLVTMRSVFPSRVPSLEDWVESQWTRAHQFRLRTHEDGYTVLEADSAELMGNVAQQKLDESHLHAPISETEAWVRDDAVADVKRTLYDAGYPVVDDRDLERGDALDVDLTTDLRDYQQSWVDEFVEKRAGVFVGPPGSGKTVAAIGALVAVGGETLILVPSRELAEQWEDELLAHTTLAPADVGQYHGGQKEIRPVTVATYQTAGMDRHRALFDSREWGLLVLDEVHHIPAPVFRRAADLQSRHRLGLSATPVRESGDAQEIYTLVGPPIGTDWSELFEAGFVAEPEVEIRYVPWGSEMAKNEWQSAEEGRERHQLAATNPAKVDEIERIRDEHGDPKTLVFVEYLEHGRRLADALSAPFVSGETPHRRRRELFDAFRGDGGEGDSDDVLVVSRVGDEGIDLPSAELAIVASGLGGSRRQGAQRAGRTMRPAGNALMYVLATRGTTEEDFARRQLRHLAEKGISVNERTVADDGSENP